MSSYLIDSEFILPPQVTVLTSVYNGALYLKEAIESVIHQTWTDFEFLIIDDLSTDNSVQIIKSYKDSRIKFIQNEQNIGQTASLNKGLDVANGKYIARLDQDDVCLPERLKEQIYFMQNHPEISIVCSWEYTIDAQGVKKRAWKRNLDNDGTFLGYILLGLCPIWHPSVMFNKNDILDIGGFDVSFGPAEDYELWSRIAMNRLKGVILPHFHLLQRVHGESQSVKRHKMQFDSRKRAHFKVLSQFVQKNEVNKVSSLLLLEKRFKNENLNKSSIIDLAKKINDMFECILVQQQFSEDELRSMKTKIYRRIGYGFCFATHFKHVPEKIFIIIFFILSPLYFTKFRNFISNVYSKICTFPYLIK